ISSSFSLIPPPPRSTLFPYTTLFRSVLLHRHPRTRRGAADAGGQLELRGRRTRRLCDPARRGSGAFTAIHSVPVLDHAGAGRDRSEEHTSELQSLTNLVCRLLLETKQ